MKKEQILSSLNFKTFYHSFVPSLKQDNSNGQAMGLCPFHDDHNPSLSVNLNSGLWNCFAGCGSGDVFDFYMKHKETDFKTALKEIVDMAVTGREAEKKIIKTYDYTDESGNLLFQTVRYEPKDFRPRRPDRRGGWVWNLKGVTLVPYNLPEVIKAKNVVIVEGEKDVETLRELGITATCNPMGAGKWKPEFNKYFKGKLVVIIPDNDEPGKKHAQDVAMNLKGIAESIKILGLPDLPEKGDVSDWFLKGGGKQELVGLMEATPEWQLEIGVMDVFPPQEDSLQFPDNLMSGVAGEFSELYGSYIEAPKVFLFFGFLACLGSILSDKLSLASELSTSPRLYILCLGESADDRKSTAIATPVEFFKEFIHGRIWVSYGVGSAEGLQKDIKDAPDGRLLLLLDEFKAFVSKCRIEASVLLPCVNTLFEKNHYSSRTKTSNVMLENAHLSVLAASTVQTYQNIWTNQFIDIGFTNRIFLVPGRGERKHPVPFQIPIDEKKILAIRTKDILSMVGDGLQMEIDHEGMEIFKRWYLNIEPSVHAKRIDTYAHRFMPLLAINEGKTVVDAEIVKKTIAIMDWQLAVRERLDPIDADNEIAKMEEKIRRNLKKSPLKDRDLKRAVHSSRSGLWVYKKAIENLSNVFSPEIKFNKQTKMWELVTQNVANY